LVQECTLDCIPHWALRDENNILVHKPTAELKYLYDIKKTLDFVDVEAQPTPKKTARAQLIADLPDVQRKRHLFRRGLIDEVGRLASHGWTHQIHGYVERGGKRHPITILEHICSEAARTIGIKVYEKNKTCSVATYYRWLALYGDGSDPRTLDGDFGNRGYRNQIDDSVKALMKNVMAELLEEAKHRKKQGNKPLVTMREIMSRVLDGIILLRKTNPDLPLPSRSSFYAVYNTFPAYNRDIARHGLSRTRALYRRPGQTTPVEAALSCLQFDETKLDFFVVDEERRIPLGRPWLAFYVDEYSTAIPGFYMGFDPPGDLVIGAATRHACSMKAYVQQEYPDIDKPYIMGGVGREFTFDNSLQAHGASIQAMALELDAAYKFTPSRSPWVKGLVEGAFEIGNKTFLQEMPGYVLPREYKVDKKDYDPAKNAVIGFRHLLWLWHHWLTLFHSMAPQTGSRMSRNDRWLEGTRIIKPTFLDQSRNLDFLFGIVREGEWTLDHRGVIYEGLYYYSDGLDIFRHAYGATVKVRVKVNPLDLLFIHVWDKQEQLWIPAKAREEGYATGLSLHCHTLFRRHSDRLAGRDDLEGWVEAHADLQRLIRSALPDALSIGLQTKIARVMGIGTPYIFRNLQANGLIIAPPGAAPDLPLNPLSTPTGNAAGRAQLINPLPEAISSAQKQRPIPQFRSDLTLGQKR
jgi:hypothetical protein